MSAALWPLSHALPLPRSPWLVSLRFTALGYYCPQTAFSISLSEDRTTATIN